MKHAQKRVATVGTTLVTIVIVAIAIYQYLAGGMTGETQLANRPASPTAEARPATAVPVKSSSTPAARPSPTFTAQPGDKKADFDFYVLNLSWSPDYCATSGGDDPQQCSLGKKLGFVLHGLWPQYNQGWPESCAYLKLPADVKAQFPNLFPSVSLYDHEWDKHGTCSGLTPASYLSLAKKLKESVVVPAPYKSPEQPVRVTTAQFKKELVAANPAFSESSLAVYCSGSGRFLSELYVCFSKEGQPQACSKEIHDKAAKSCGNPDFLVRNVR
jgi:ribonuclease T2